MDARRAVSPGFLVAIIVLSSAPALAQSPGGPLSAHDFVVNDASREGLISDVTRALEQKFVFPDQVTKKLPVLIGRWSSLPFSKLSSASEIVAAINSDLTDAFHDDHLFLLQEQPGDLTATIFGSGKPTAAECAEMDKVEAAYHYGLRQVTVLDHNIGYIELTHFPYFHLPGLQRAIAEAMNRVRDTAALIIDLRWNSGGDGETVAHLLAYLLDQRVLLLREYDRVTRKHHEAWTPATVPGPRYGAKRSLWVLTSHGTLSGGEAFAYAVQTLKRGRLVGETTRGGAHHNQMVRVGGHFVMSVPIATVESPVTHTSWEGVGVKPDVAVDAQRALDVALAEAHKVR